MVAAGAYIDHLAKQLLPFRGKEVPEDLVEDFIALDKNAQQAVRDRLRALLNATAQKSVTPKTRHSPYEKRSRLLAMLQEPGGHLVADLSRELNTTTNSVCAMLSVLRKQGHRIIKSEKQGRNGYSKFQLVTDDEEEKPLSRQERGRLGGLTARGGVPRPPCHFEENAIRLLENAGEVGLSIVQWSEAMKCTPGGLYRRITTMRRKGYDIVTQRGPGPLNHYVWHGPPNAQASLFEAGPAPRVIARKDAAALFSVTVSAMQGWVRRGILQPPSSYTVDGAPVYGWEERVIEELVDKYPAEGFARGRKRKQTKDDAKPEVVADPVIDEEPIVDIPAPPIESEMVVERAPEPPEPAPTAPQLSLETLLVELRPFLVEAIRRDAAERYGELLAAVQSIRADQTDRMPAIEALRALDLHMPQGFDGGELLAALNEGSDPRSVRDWLWKLQGKLKRLAQLASEQV